MKALKSDRFEAQVYYVETIDIFHTIDYHAAPSVGDWVAVRRWDAPGLAIEPFRGQRFIGVARILNFHRLAHSEQGTLRSLPVFPD
jgi:hypothetical protein